MGSVEVLRDHHNLLDDPPYLQRARMADQLYHSLDRLRMQRTGLLQIEPGRASPVQIKKKLRRLSEGPQKGGSSLYPLDVRDSKENESSLSYSPSRASSVSSTLSRPILKRKYLPGTLTRPKHVHFLSDVTVFQVGQDGTHVCTSSEQLNTEPSSRLIHKSHHHISSNKSLGVTSQDSTDSSRGVGRVSGGAVVTHAVLDKPGKGKVGVGAVVTPSSLPTSPQNKTSNYAVTVSTAFPTHPSHKFDNPGQLNSESRVNVQNKSSASDVNSSSKPIPNNSSTGRTTNMINPSKSNPNHSHNSSSTTSVSNSYNPSTSHSSSIGHNNNHMSGNNNYNSNTNNRNLNISFTQDPTQGTKCKFVVGIGQGYDPEDIVVKANMNGSRIRIMATKVVTRPDGTNDVQQFNERFVLPMDIDPFTVDARLDSKGLLTVEAPLMTLERRQSQTKNDSNQTTDTL